MTGKIVPETQNDLPLFVCFATFLFFSRISTNGLVICQLVLYSSLIVSLYSRSMEAVMWPLCDLLLVLSQLRAPIIVLLYRRWNWERKTSISRHTTSKTPSFNSIPFFTVILIFHSFFLSTHTHTRTHTHTHILTTFNLISSCNHTVYLASK